MSAESPDRRLPLTIIFMGVAGSGKTTAARLLAEQLNWTYFEADEFHSQENVRKMSSGTPLDDCDRLPWLQSIASKIRELQSAGQNAVFTCSALRREYRRILHTGGQSGSVFFVYLQAPREVLNERLANRQGHYMKAQMLESQLETLEEPSAEEALTIDARLSPNDVVCRVRADLQI